jgi:hypothetical protein
MLENELVVVKKPVAKKARKAIDPKVKVAREIKKALKGAMLKNSERAGMIRQAAVWAWKKNSLPCLQGALAALKAL